MGSRCRMRTRDEGSPQDDASQLETKSDACLDGSAQSRLVGRCETRRLDRVRKHPIRYGTLASGSTGSSAFFTTA
jgi:hypothetical protein